MADSLGLKVAAQSFDHGKRIGVAVEYNGERRAFRFDNPFWPEIDAAYQAKQKERERG